jgi:hypothetical protein
VEEKGYIAVTISGKIGNEPITPQNVDIAEIKELINDVETFLYPTRAAKAERPLIAYGIEEGSARHLFYVPISAVLFFNALTAEIAERGTTEFLDYKRAEIIAKFQQKAREKNLNISFSSSKSVDNTLTINTQTNYFNSTANYINTEMVLYGKINNEGGNNPNFHILTKEYGRLTVSATEQQLLEGEKRLFKVYGVKVSGKQNLTDGKLYDLKLIDYIEYNPVFNRSELDMLITRAAGNWEDVTDVDAWLAEIRSGTNG